MTHLDSGNTCVGVHAQFGDPRADKTHRVPCHHCLICGQWMQPGAMSAACPGEQGPLHEGQAECLAR